MGRARRARGPAAPARRPHPDADGPARARWPAGEARRMGSRLGAGTGDVAPPRRGHTRAPGRAPGDARRLRRPGRRGAGGRLGGRPGRPGRPAGGARLVTDLREAVGVAVAPDAEKTAGNGQRAPIAITVAGLTKNYGEIEAVRGIDFEVPTGETFGFLGPHGAGQSTTIKILCTLARPTPGTR